MSVLLRIAAAALLASAVTSLLRRSNPELGVPLSAAVWGFALMCLLSLLTPLRDVMLRSRDLSGVDAAYFAPVVKCTLIGVAARAASDLCRDSGQSAMAGAVELGGTAAALYVSLPLIASFLDFLEGLL